MHFSPEGRESEPRPAFKSKGQHPIDVIEDQSVLILHDIEMCHL